MSGDYTSHDVATKSTDPTIVEHHYNVSKEIYNHLYEGLVKNYFGSQSIIMPAFGNNDYKRHYGYPLNSDEKSDFYNFAYGKFFTTQPVNNKAAQLGGV